MSTGTHEFRRWLPNDFQTGQKVFVRVTGRPEPEEAVLVGYTPQVPRWWSTWYMRFVRPQTARDTHDRELVEVDGNLHNAKARQSYRTVYEGALANALVTPK